MLNEQAISDWSKTNDVIYATSDSQVVESFYNTFQIDDPHKAAQILVDYTLARTLQLQQLDAPVAVQAHQLISFHCVIASLLKI
jgi:hypothetical protein